MAQKPLPPTGQNPTLPRDPAMALAKALEYQATQEPNKKFRKNKQAAAKKLREMASEK